MDNYSKMYEAVYEQYEREKMGDPEFRESYRTMSSIMDAASAHLDFDAMFDLMMAVSDFAFHCQKFFYGKGVRDGVAAHALFEREAARL